MDHLLSIVIPVYNVAPTLPRCLNSIARYGADYQTILVDDGATDDSGRICDEWAAKQRALGACVEVVHQKNGGLSEARNAGIERATAEFITFIDSDDYVDEGIYEQARRLLTPDTDILEFGVIKEKGNGTEKLSFTTQTFTSLSDYWLMGHAYQHTYAWNKIYRRSLFDEIRYPAGKVFEDILTLPYLVKRARQVKTCPLGFYHYCINPNGITGSAKGEEWRVLLKAHLDSYCLISEQIANYPTAEQTIYYADLLNIQLQEHLLTGDPPEEINYRLSIRHSPYKAKALLYHLIGVKGLCRLISFLKTRK
ncbi:glycosyltransferase family 2 protein [Prevotella dentasini]